MIDRRYDRIAIVCDSCDDEYEGESGENFGVVWGRAKATGWRVRKIAGEWTHECPGCGASA